MGSQVLVRWARSLPGQLPKQRAAADEAPSATARFSARMELELKSTGASAM